DPEPLHDQGGRQGNLVGHANDRHGPAHGAARLLDGRRGRRPRRSAVVPRRQPLGRGFRRRSPGRDRDPRRERHHTLARQRIPVASCRSCRGRGRSFRHRTGQGGPGPAGPTSSKRRKGEAMIKCIFHVGIAAVLMLAIDGEAHGRGFGGFHAGGFGGFHAGGFGGYHAGGFGGYHAGGYGGYRAGGFGGYRAGGFGGDRFSYSGS